eukprot:RCo011931
MACTFPAPLRAGQGFPRCSLGTGSFTVSGVRPLKPLGCEPSSSSNCSSAETATASGTTSSGNGGVRKRATSVRRDRETDLNRSREELCKAAELGLKLAGQARLLREELESARKEHEAAKLRLEAEVDQLKLEKAELMRRNATEHAASRSFLAQSLVAVEVYEQEKAEAENRVVAAEQACQILRGRLKDARLEALRSQQALYTAAAARASVDLLGELTSGEEEARELLLVRQEHELQVLLLLFSPTAASGASGTGTLLREHLCAGDGLPPAALALAPTDSDVFLDSPEEFRPESFSSLESTGGNKDAKNELIALRLSTLHLLLRNQLSAAEDRARLELHNSESSAFELLQRLAE